MTRSPAYLLSILAGVVLGVCALSSGAWSDTLRLAYTEGSPYQEIAAPILAKAYERLGLSVETVPLPGRRALRSSAHGRMDGEVIRLAIIEKHHPDLVRVPVPVIEIRNFGFARAPLDTIRTPDDLGDHSVGIIRGLVVLEAFTEGKRRKLFNTQSEMFAALLKGRVDLILSNQYDALKYGEDGLHITAEPLHSDPAYHYLHKKHAALLPQITEALTTVLAEGERERVIRQLTEQWRVNWAKPAL